jgi:hypothetical protein
MLLLGIWNAFYLGFFGTDAFLWGGKIVGIF